MSDARAPGLPETLRRLLGGDAVDSGANAPRLLTDPDELWVVEAGELDVFLVPMRDGEVDGRRRFLWSAEVGQAVLGATPRRISGGDGAGLCLLAVGTAGTRLRRFSLAALESAASSDENAASAFAEVIDSFLAGVTGAAHEIERPQLDTRLTAGEKVSVEEGKAVGSTDGVVWVRHRSGSSRFLGVEALVVDAEDDDLPLGPGMFLRAAAAPTELAAVDTRTCVREGRAAAGVTLVRALFMGLADELLGAERERERERLRRKAGAEETMRRHGLAELAEVLSRATTPLSAIDAASPLLAACQVLGAVTGMTFVAPPAWETSGRVRDELGAICRASRIRSRRVGLRDGWWRTDSGPLLAYLQESVDEAGAGDVRLLQPDHTGESGTAIDPDSPARRPVALIPDGRGRYHHFDPDRRDLEKVDAAFADKLEPFAHAFYRPLPDEPIGVPDLMRMVLQDVGNDLYFVLALAFGSGLLALALPLATGKMFSSVIPDALTDQVWILFAALVAVNIGNALFDLTRAFAIVRVEGKTTASVQAAVVDRLLALPVPFFRSFSTGDLTQRALGINTARSMLSGAAITSILAGFFSITNLGLMFYYDWRLALVAVGILVFVSLITVALSIPALRAERQRVETQGRIAGLVFQMITGIAKLRIAAAESRGFSVWAERFHVQKAQAYRARGLQNAVAVINDTVPLLATLALFATAVWLMNQGNSFNTGQFIAFNAAFGVFFASGVQLSNTVVNLLNVQPILERAQPILQAVPEVDAAKPDPGELTGAIEVSHVKFRYVDDGPLILDDVSFRANPGEFIAFVGPSGSGKSTTLRLLLGFETPESGTISYDGQDLEGLDHAAVRSQIGVVLQSSRILAGDIFTNLVGSSPLSIDDAWEAAEAAGIADDIRAMPMGMHTVIAEGGSTISGGQRQRLLIARALIRKPRLIFFDEATSALDNRTQKQVTDSLDALHTTRIVIAHRLSTIRHADRIFVIEKGRVVQAGSFDELAGQPGLFDELIKRQMA